MTDLAGCLAKCNIGYISVKCVFGEEFPPTRSPTLYVGSMSSCLRCCAQLYMSTSGVQLYFRTNPLNVYVLVCLRMKCMSTVEEEEVEEDEKEIK